MRVLVLALALLAALKIWVQDGAYRAAAEDAIVAAYRAPAAEACAEASRLSPSAAPAGQGAVGWAASPTSRLAIGDPTLTVRLWQVDHGDWHARFRQLYLVLGGGDAGLSCSYDLSAGKAKVFRS